MDNHPLKKADEEWQLWHPVAGVISLVLMLICMTGRPNVHNGASRDLVLMAIMFIAAWIVIPIWLLANTVRVILKRERFAKRDWVIYFVVLGTYSSFWIYGIADMLHQMSEHP